MTVNNFFVQFVLLYYSSHLQIARYLNHLAIFATFWQYLDLLVRGFDRLSRSQFLVLIGALFHSMLDAYPFLQVYHQLGPII